MIESHSAQPGTPRLRGSETSAVGSNGLDSEVRTAAPWTDGDSLELSLVPGEDEAACLALWEQLEKRLGHARLTSQVSWVRRWLRHYGDMVEHQFAVGKAGGRVRGIALVVRSTHQRRGPFRLRTIHLGTAGEPHAHSVVVEFNTLLVEQAWETCFMRQLLDTLGSDAGGWDEIRFDGIDPQDWRAMGEVMPPFSGSVVRRSTVREHRYCDLAELRGRNQDLLSSLGGSTRSNLKRRLKQYKALESDWAGDLPAALGIFEELKQLHQQRWQSAGSPGAFASERFAQFQRGLLEDLFDEGRVVVFRARDGQETIGCLLLLVEQGRLLDYLSGFAPLERGKSPGMVTHYLCMEEALKRGYLAYDFLAGDKRHKENLGKCAGELHWVSWSRITWKHCLCEVLGRIRALCRTVLGSARGWIVGEPVVTSEWALQMVSWA